VKRTPSSALISAVAAVAVAGGLLWSTAYAQSMNTGTPAPTAPVPSNTPILNIETPPLSVAAPLAVDSCANDVFLAQRSIPAPTVHDVTICGTVLAAGAGFTLDIDGTSPIPILGASGLGAKPGDTAIIRGRYHRAGSGAEWIDHTQQAGSGSWSQPGYTIVPSTTQ
jgi:hypothetical protein